MASERMDSLAGSPDDRYPIRGIFFGCCASADTLSTKSTAHRAKLPSFRLFISPSRLMAFASRRAVLVSCLNLGNIHLPLSDKKQAGLEIVGLSCQCSVQVRSGLTLNQRFRVRVSGSQRKLIQGWVGRTLGRTGFAYFATTLPELSATMCSNR
jgi:hypothetical protein